MAKTYYTPLAACALRGVRQRAEAIRASAGAGLTGEGGNVDLASEALQGVLL